MKTLACSLELYKHNYNSSKDFKEMHICIGEVAIHNNICVHANIELNLDRMLVNVFIAIPCRAML